MKIQKQLNQWSMRINVMVTIAILTSAIFLTALTWPMPATSKGAAIAAEPTATLVNTLAPPTKTTFPPEYATNGQQTIGLTYIGAILVLIVVVGVVLFMPKGK